VNVVHSTHDSKQEEDQNLVEPDLFLQFRVIMSKIGNLWFVVIDLVILLLNIFYLYLLSPFYIYLSGCWCCDLSRHIRYWLLWFFRLIGEAWFVHWLLLRVISSSNWWFSWLYGFFCETWLLHSLSSSITIHSSICNGDIRSCIYDSPLLVKSTPCQLICNNSFLVSGGSVLISRSYLSIDNISRVEMYVLTKYRVWWWSKVLKCIGNCRSCRVLGLE